MEGTGPDVNVKTYDVIATPSEGWWSLEVPSVPGVVSQGKSHEEVIFMATDAISLILEIPKNSIEVAVEYRGQLSETLNK